MVIELEEGDTVVVKTDDDRGELSIDLEGKIQFKRY